MSIANGRDVSSTPTTTVAVSEHVHQWIPLFWRNEYGPIVHEPVKSQLGYVCACGAVYRLPKGRAAYESLEN